MTNPQDEPATMTPRQLVQLLITEGLAGDEAGAALILEAAIQHGALQLIVPGPNLPAPLPIDWRNDCAWNRRVIPAARVSLVARVASAQRVIQVCGTILDRGKSEAGISAHPAAMKRAIKAAIGDGHARADEVLQAAQIAVQARTLTVCFAASLCTWRAKFAAWHPGPDARPWLPVRPDECEALGSADGCMPGGEVPRSPVWRIDTARGLAERQDGHGTWRPVGPVLVDGAELRASAAKHVASSAAVAAEGRRGAVPWESDPGPWQRAQLQLIAWCDEEGAWPLPGQHGGQALLERRLLDFASVEGKPMSEATARRKVRAILHAPQAERAAWPLGSLRVKKGSDPL